MFLPSRVGVVHASSSTAINYSYDEPTWLKGTDNIKSDEKNVFKSPVKGPKDSIEIKENEWKLRFDTNRDCNTGIPG
ncbi:hypothetical protein TNCV_2989481 [Trichonephila clavipes]|nr:hypothetical protein TNCV_2989481 [Trichonephila clavipes]